MSFGKALKKALKQCAVFVTNPLTHKAREQVKDEYQKTLLECEQAQQSALLKLETEYQTECKQAHEKLRVLEASQHAEETKYRTEFEYLTKYLADKEKAFQETRELIQNYFELLTACVYASALGATEIIDNALPFLNQNTALRKYFMALNLLHISADNNQIAVLKSLSKVMDIHRKDKQGQTPLSIAAERGFKDVCIVLEAIIEVTESFWTAAHAADIKAMKESLAQGAAINASLPNGYTLLEQMIVDKKPYALIRWLAETGAYSDCPPIEPSPPSPVVPVLETKALEQEISAAPDFSGINHLFKSILGDKLPPLTEMADSIPLFQPAKTLRFTQSHSSNDKQVNFVKPPEKPKASPILPLAVHLAGSHPDWRVRNFLETFWDAEIDTPTTKMHWALPADRKELVSELLFKNTSLQHRIFRCTTLLSQGESTLFFEALLSGAVLQYNLLTQHWSQLPFRTPEPNRKQHPIQFQTIRTNEGQELLFLLTEQAGLGVTLWRYTEQSLQPCKPYPHFELKNMNIGSCSAQETLYFINQPKQGKAELCIYSIIKDEWCVHPFNMEIPENTVPQLSLVHLSSGEECLFMLLSKDILNAELELWCYEFSKQHWVLKPSDLWPKLHIPHRTVQMQALQVSGVSVLFFLECFEQGTKLYSFNPQTLAWSIHTGCPQWPLPSFQQLIDLLGKTKDHSTLSHYFQRHVLKLQAVPCHEENSEMLLISRQSSLGLECHVYHPRMNAWETIHSTEFTSEHLKHSDNWGIQHHLGCIKQRHQLTVLHSTKGSTQSFSVPINFLALERKLLAAPHPARIHCSESFILQLQQFLEKTIESTNLLLTSARTGDWVNVFNSLANGANIHAYNEQGYNPLQLALKSKVDMSTLKRLLQAGIAVQGQNALETQRVLKLAKNTKLDVYNYLADLLERPVLMHDFDVQRQFLQHYHLHFAKAERFLAKQTTGLQKCQVIFNYYRLLTNRYPYAVYSLPALLILGEMLKLPTLLEGRTGALKAVQQFFVETHAAHKALIAIGVTNQTVLSALPHRDWTHVIAATLLKEEAISYATTHRLDDTDIAVLCKMYQQQSAWLYEGMLSTLQGLAKALFLHPKQTSWLKDAAEWLTSSQQKAPHALREYYQNRTTQTIPLATAAALAYETELLPPPPKLSLQPTLDFIATQKEKVIEIIQEDKQAFVKEKEELEQWMAARKKEYLDCIHQIAQLIEETQGMSAKLHAQYQKTLLEINTHFALAKDELHHNKEQALARIRHHAVKSLAVMMGACVAANVFAHIISSAIASATTLERNVEHVLMLNKILKGAIMGGINGAFAKENISKAILKSGGFALLGCAINEMFDNVITESMSVHHHTLNLALTTGMESGIRVALEHGDARSIPTTIGTGLLLDKLPFNNAATDFLSVLRCNLVKSLIGGAVVYVGTTHKHFGYSMASSAINGLAYTVADSVGNSIAKSVVPLSYSSLPSLHAAEVQAVYAQSGNQYPKTGLNCEANDFIDKPEPKKKSVVTSSTPKLIAEPGDLQKSYVQNQNSNSKTGLNRTLVDLPSIPQSSDIQAFVTVGQPPVSTTLERVLNFVIPTANADEWSEQNCSRISEVPKTSKIVKFFESLDSRGFGSLSDDLMFIPGGAWGSLENPALKDISKGLYDINEEYHFGTRTLATLQAFGGGAQILAGSTISATGIGAVLGVSITIIGADNVITGTKTCVTGIHQPTLLFSAAKAVGTSTGLYGDQVASFIELGANLSTMASPRALTSAYRIMREKPRATSSEIFPEVILEGVAPISNCRMWNAYQNKPLPHSASDNVRLKVELTLKQAGIIDVEGKLTEEAIHLSKIAWKQGSIVGNPTVKNVLIQDGSKIEDWIKFTTPSIRLSNGQSVQVHYYKNIVSKKIDYSTYDFKIKGRVESLDGDLYLPNIESSFIKNIFKKQ